jgi:hypothetical protein
MPHFGPKEGPRLTAANSLHFELQCEIIIKCWNIGHVRQQVTFDVYFSLIQDKFVPFLQEYGTEMNTA